MLSNVLVSPAKALLDIYIATEYQGGIFELNELVAMKQPELNDRNCHFIVET